MLKHQNFQVNDLSIAKESATIPNHVDGSRNHLDSLLESGNQAEILESRIIISTFILRCLVLFRIFWITCNLIDKPLFGEQESQKSFEESRNFKPGFRRKFRVTGPPSIAEIYQVSACPEVSSVRS